MSKNLNELSNAELRTLVAKQEEQLRQKDRQIAHLSRNAQKWVQKFDDHQNNVAESVIKKFEQEFEHERNELHAKLAKLTQLNNRLVARYQQIDQAAQAAMAKANAAAPAAQATVSAEKVSEEIELDILVEPASITEIEFSKEMREVLSKYSS